MDTRLNRPVSRKELEASLEAYFRKTVRLLGGRPVKLAPTEKGIPDRLLLMPGGIMLLVELKTERGALSAAQQVWHQRAAELGTPVAVVVGRDGVDRWADAYRASYMRLKNQPRSYTDLTRAQKDDIYRAEIAR